MVMRTDSFVKISTTLLMFECRKSKYDFTDKDHPKSKVLLLISDYIIIPVAPEYDDKYLQQVILFILNAFIISVGKKLANKSSKQKYAGVCKFII